MISVLPVVYRTNGALVTILKKVRSICTCHCKKNVIKNSQVVCSVVKNTLKTLEPTMRQAHTTISLMKEHSIIALKGSSGALVKGSYFIFAVPAFIEFSNLSLRRWQYVTIEKKVKKCRKELRECKTEEDRAAVSSKIQELLKDQKDAYSKIYLLNLFATIAQLITRIVAALKKNGAVIPLIAASILEAVAACFQLVTKIVDLVDAIKNNKGRVAILQSVADICIALTKILKPILVFVLTATGFAPHVLIVLSMIGCALSFFQCIKSTLSMISSSCVTGTMKVELALRWIVWIFSLVVALTGLVDFLAIFDVSLSRALLVMNIVLTLSHIPILGLVFHNQAQEAKRIASA
ncbi:hypothetical protein [Candidatus Similichlamydia epinepheli]|uniref:hypothetical protein n=1 Tax=Candidatus Similichlamydia epinepheli TaxID=1903953 RepID=UPI000D3D47FD|nr:hypothetical protein [Candidatus Similichlamydia epinepheli]